MPTLLLLSLLLSQLATRLEAVRFLRGNATRGSTALTHYSASPSAIHCGCLCTRLRDCSVWTHDAASGVCTLWPLPSSADAAVQDPSGFQDPSTVPPPGFVAGPNGVLFAAITTNPVPWSGGQDRCRQVDSRANMAIPTDTDTVELLKTIAVSTYNFIGVICNADGTYSSHAGAPVSIPAAWFIDGTAPTACDATTGCLSVRNTGLFTHTCSHAHYVLCQIQMDSP